MSFEGGGVVVQGQARAGELSRSSSHSSSSHAHRDESPVPHQRTEVVHAGGTDNHLSVLKARLQAEKSRTQGQHAGISKYALPHTTVLAFPFMVNLGMLKSGMR
jgi:hypothetical protein